MSSREKIKRGPVEARNELDAGRVSVMSGEEERVRAQAIAAGQNPDAAVLAFREKIAKANGKLRERQGHEARMKFDRYGRQN